MKIIAHRIVFVKIIAHRIVFVKIFMQREVWDAIAEPWQSFRSRRDAEIEEFVSGSGLILDIGCGSGRNFIPGRTFVGTDISYKMLRYAKEHAEKLDTRAFLILADALHLPFKGGFFQKMLLIRVLHVVEDRKMLIQEVRRVLSAKGSAVVIVWNRSQPRFFFRPKEGFIPWKSRGRVFNRYYYLFTEQELVEFFRENGLEVSDIHGSREKAFNVFPKNIVAIVKRGSPSGQWD